LKLESNRGQDDKPPGNTYNRGSPGKQPPSRRNVKGQVVGWNSGKIQKPKPKEKKKTNNHKRGKSDFLKVPRARGLGGVRKARGEADGDRSKPVTRTEGGGPTIMLVSSQESLGAHSSPGGSKKKARGNLTGEGLGLGRKV